MVNRSGKISALPAALAIALLLFAAPVFAAMDVLPKSHLWKQVARGNANEVADILSKHVIDDDSLGKALWLAATRSSPRNRETTLEITHLLLDKGAMVDYVDVYERTPLMIACENRDPDMVRLLLEHGADPTMMDSRGRRALDYAAEAASEAGTILDMLNKNR